MSAKDKKSRTSHRELFVVSKDAPFQFVEAYKSLRTNLEFLSATSNHPDYFLGAGGGQKQRGH